MKRSIDNAGDRKKAKHRKEKSRRVGGNEPGLVVPQKQSIAPWWVMVLMFNQEFCANIPWEKFWDRVGDVVDLIVSTLWM